MAERSRNERPAPGESDPDSVRRVAPQAGEDARDIGHRAQEMGQDARRMQQDAIHMREELDRHRGATHRIAVFPGTFDPITLGHLDVIRRGAKLFDELVIAVGRNPEKSSLLPPERRVEIIRQAVEGLKRVRVQSFEGLTVDFARRVGASAILRGIRNSSDLQYEFQVALTNRVVAGVETVFVMTSPQYAFTSSSLIRQIASQGGDVSALVPEGVLPYLTGQPATPDDALHETE